MLHDSLPVLSRFHTGLLGCPDVSHAGRINLENLKKTAKEFGDTTSGECGLVSCSFRPLIAGLAGGRDGEE